MIVYKFDVLEKLDHRGWNAYKLRVYKIFGESTLTKLRKGEIISGKNLDVLCKLLNMQPGEILEYKADDDVSLQ